MTTSSPTTTRSTTRRWEPGGSGRPSSPGGTPLGENPHHKPRRRMSKKKLEVLAVKLVQDQSTLGPRLKPDKEYVHSWVAKGGDIISHDYRRNKISPDDPSPHPRLTIYGVRPPGRAEDHQGRSEKGELSLMIRGIHMADVRLNISQGNLRSEIKDIQEDFNCFQDYHNARMDSLDNALGIPDVLDEVPSEDLS